TRLWKVLLVDILQIGGLPPNLLLGNYFLHLNFFDHDHYALDIVNDLLVKRHNVLIIFRRLKNQRNTYDYIRKYCYTVLSLLQLFALFNVGFIVATELIGLFQILQLPYSFFILILVAIIGEINLLIYYGALFTFSYSLILQGTLAFTLLEAVRIVLLQLKQCLDMYVHILVAISKGICYVGKAFIPLMLVCCPTNAVLMVSLLIYQEMSLAARVTLSVVVVEQFICVFLVHYIIAIHNDNLGRLARCISFSIQRGYFIYLNYFDPEHYALDLMGNIIIRKRCHLFTQNKRNIFHHIARYCLKVLNLFQAFTLFIDLFIVACEVIGLKILYQLSAEAYSTKVLISTGISWQANILLYHGSIFTFAYALILQGTIAFVLIEIIRLLLQQQQVFLEKLKRAKNQRSRVRLAQRYQNRYTDLLIAICRSNCYASKAFIPLMLVNFPTNGVLMVSLLTISKQMWPVTRVTLFVIMIEQFLCIFIVHSLLALLNDRLAALARRYIPFHYNAIYRHEYTKAVVTITSGNHYLGVAFVPLLLVNCPANALLTIVLLTWNLVFGARFILLMLMLQQFICIFVIHSLVAHLNDRLTMLAKMFIPFIYADRSFSYVSTLKQKLFNCLFLSSFYTVNPVGFTYYTFGRFSMLNFVKCSIF
ncbi:hypothetical protein TYRP_023314, partial [Tyrophagus putrescentiae]